LKSYGESRCGRRKRSRRRCRLRSVGLGHSADGGRVWLQSRDGSAPCGGGRLGGVPPPTAGPSPRWAEGMLAERLRRHRRPALNKSTNLDLPLNPRGASSSWRP
jgi:hypothetical protein